MLLLTEGSQSYVLLVHSCETAASSLACICLSASITPGCQHAYFAYTAHKLTFLQLSTSPSIISSCIQTEVKTRSATMKHPASGMHARNMCTHCPCHSRQQISGEQPAAQSSPASLMQTSCVAQMCVHKLLLACNEPEPCPQQKPVQSPAPYQQLQSNYPSQAISIKTAASKLRACTRHVHSLLLLQSASKQQEQPTPIAPQRTP